MAPKVDEVDVFTIPHCRMKQLVQSCKQKLTITDFTNGDALIVLLNNLYSVFKEFKSHEEIENECIMRKLKSKLKEMKIHNSAVCNCHSSDQFSPLFDLVDSGYVYINKQKSASDKIGYGVKLRRALKSFASEFLPHMKEEEEIFQPLLCEYFDEEELVEMKTTVIKLHLQKRKQLFDNKLDICSQNDAINHVDSLPNEILLKVFSYIKQTDLIVPASVCKKWRLLSYDCANWKHLSFVEWKKPDQQKHKSGGGGYKDIEYIDDSDEEFDNEDDVCINDIRLLQYWIKVLLPKIGNHIECLDLSNCKSINNNLARRIFQLCPNIKTLKISFSSIGDNAFKRVKFDKLENINFEGCTKISDKTFKQLFIELVKSDNESFDEQKLCSTLNKIENKNSAYCDAADIPRRCYKCLEKYRIGLNIEDINYVSCLLNSHSKARSSLINLNLSGCFMITDYGLNFIGLRFSLSNLLTLNLSGCYNLTSNGLNNFVNLCTCLNEENLYYCDYIVNGPFDNNANGCENVECTNKVCCRNGNKF